MCEQWPSSPNTASWDVFLLTDRVILEHFWLIVSHLKFSQKSISVVLFYKRLLGIMRGNQSGLAYIATGFTRGESKRPKIQSTFILLFLKMILLIPNQALLALSFNSWTANEKLPKGWVLPLSIGIHQLFPIVFHLI